MIKLGSESSCNSENISNNNSGIHSVNSKNVAKKCKQSNQSNPAELINLDSDGIGDGGNCDSRNDNSDIHSVKKRKISIYDDTLCIECKNKEYKDYCGVCRGAYDCAKSNNCYAKKIKISHLKNQSKPTDQTQQVPTNTNSSFKFPSASSGNNIYIYIYTG